MVSLKNKNKNKKTKKNVLTTLSFLVFVSAFVFVCSTWMTCPLKPVFRMIRCAHKPHRCIHLELWLYFCANDTTTLVRPFPVVGLPLAHARRVMTVVRDLPKPAVGIERPSLHPCLIHRGQGDAPPEVRSR